MSILIKNMVMPKSCANCPLFEDKYHFHGCHAESKSFNDMDMWNFVGDRPSWCPLVELPPHGRLIDADALKVALKPDVDDVEHPTSTNIWRTIDYAKAIIEADTCNNSKETCNKADDDAVNASNDVEIAENIQELIKSPRICAEEVTDNNSNCCEGCIKYDVESYQYVFGKCCDDLLRMAANTISEFEAYAKNQEDCIKDLVAELEAKEKTGKWTDKWYCSNMSGYEYAMNCSVCGKPTYRISLVEPMPPYCPNCGARMVEDG